jgi:phosphoenolpyruvate-protein kinase (PTS system EI component)
MGEKIIDEWGEHLVNKYKNGIVTKVLIKPSKKYLEKVEKRKKEHEKKMEEKKKLREKEKLIQDRMRQIAIDQLKEEGKL